jgi:tetratricopeptide (TPR) repeat protein
MSRKAIALDAELAEGYKAAGLAYLSKGAWRQALEASRKAVEINPGHAAATQNVGAELRSLGRFDEALSWLLRASELDPANPVVAAGVGTGYEALGEPKRAERWFKQSVKLQPDLGQGQAYLVCFYLRHNRDVEALQQAHNAILLLPQDPFALNAAAITELVTGNLQRANQLFEQVLPALRGTRLGWRNGGAGVETHLAYLRFQAEKRAEANTFLEDSFATDRRLPGEGDEDWSVPYDTACAHALRGEKDEAFRWLDKAVETGWRGWPLGTRSPLLDSLRSDPRFRRIEAHLEELVGQMRRRAGLS